MKFLKKIKLEYNTKLFNDFLTNKKYDSAYKFILDLKEKDQIDFFLFLKDCHNKLIDLPHDFYKKKIVWTLSYDLRDVSFINKFLKLYLPKNSKTTFDYKNYANSLSEYFARYHLEHQNDKVTFNDIMHYSSLYQNLLLFDCNKEFLFLESCASFFEASQKQYFTNTNITNCYFYVVANPETLYSRYKKIYDSSEASFNEIFNFTDESFLNPDQGDQKLKVFENRTNLNTNIKSWTDFNVKSTYKGKIISYQRLVEETEDVLTEILFHLKQFNFDLEINVEDIKNFISTNDVFEKNEHELSKNEKKILNRNLDQSIDFT